MITKDGRDARVENLTAENYIVPKGEERVYHCVIEVVQYDPKTGEKLSNPRVQKFGKKTFESVVEKSLKKQGYTLTILHDPNEWIKQHQAEAAAKAKAQAEAKAKAEQEKFDAAVEAAVARALAEREAAEAKAAAEEAERAKAEAKAKEEASAQVGEQAEKKGPGRPKNEK